MKKKLIAISLLGLLTLSTLGACANTKNKVHVVEPKAEVIPKADIFKEIKDSGFTEVSGDKTITFDDAEINVKKVEFGSMSKDYKKFGIDEEQAKTSSMNTIGKITYTVKNKGEQEFAPSTSIYDKNGNSLVVSIPFSVEKEADLDETVENEVLFFSPEKDLKEVYVTIGNFTTANGVIFPVTVQYNK